MGDHPTAVALYGAIVTGLYRRERTGTGTKVSTSLMANGVWANGIMAQAALCDAKPFEPFTHLDARNPLLNAYRTRDGRALLLVMVKEAFEWEMFCDAIDREDLKSDPRFADSAQRHANARMLVELLDAVFAQKDLAEWIPTLERNRITFSIVQRYDAIPDDPQMREAGLFLDIEGAPGRRTVDSPITVLGESKRVPLLAPELGQHTREVLAAAGYDHDELQRLQREGAFGRA